MPEKLRIDVDIACINTVNQPAMLISTNGFHCHVWAINRIKTRNGRRSNLDLVLKQHLRPCTPQEVELLQRDYRLLRKTLGDMVPSAVFVQTQIDNQPNVVVLARTVRPWFNLANPANEEESIPLLRKLPQTRKQLRRFVEAAEHWYETSDRVIDLWGLDNLVLDRDRQVRYIDSFRVFFYADILHTIDDVDDMLRDRISISRQRLQYLRHLLNESDIPEAIHAESKIEAIEG